MNNIPKGKMISLSSWNYGSYSITNPYYNKMNLKSPPIKIYQSESLINCNNNNQKNEKIVKKIYFENLDYMKYISRDDKDKNSQRPKSARNNNRKNNNNILYFIIIRHKSFTRLFSFNKIEYRIFN